MKLRYLKSEILLWAELAPRMALELLEWFVFWPLYEAIFTEGQQEAISQINLSKGRKAGLRYILILLLKKSARFVIIVPCMILFVPAFIIGILLYLIGYFLWSLVEDHLWPVRRWLLRRQWAKNAPASPEATHTTARQ
jgi:hypothetical protein